MELDLIRLVRKTAQLDKNHDYLALYLMLRGELEEERIGEVLNHLHGVEPASRGCVKCEKVQEVLVELNESLKKLLEVLSQ